MRITSLIGIICAGCVLAAAFSAASAKPAGPSRDDVVSKIVEAYGGKAVLDSIKSTKIVLSTTMQSEPTTITTTEAPPNRVVVIFAITALHLQVTTGFDGTHGWVQDSYGHLKLLSGDQLTQARCQAIDEIYEVEHPSQSAATVTLQPSQIVDGKKYFVIEMDHKGCGPTTLFVDPLTYLIARETGSQQTIDFSGYTTGPVGEKYPKFLAITTAIGTTLATVTSLDDNVPVDDSMFAIPAASAPPATAAPSAAPLVTPAPPASTAPPVTPAPAPTKPASGNR